MKTAQFLKTLFAIVLMIIVLPSVALAADQLKSSRLWLSDPRAGQTSSHTFTFTINTGSANMSEMQFQYCTTPSGTCSAPTDLSFASADLDEAASSGITDWGWTVTAASLGTNTLVLQQSTTGENIVEDTVVVVDFDTVTNSSITACQASKDDTDTCYVKITTCGAIGCATALDVATVSYTTVAAVTVSARVDPTFTFVISGVNSGTGTVGNATTTVSSTYATLPFSNLTAGTQRYAAHKLTVTTNTDSGYVVYIRMQQQMTGVYGGNVDPYAATDATWANPIPWTEPSGSTPNVDTGWIGANTVDTDVANWATNKDGSDNALFGPVNATENMVMKSTLSDNGSSSVYVTYAIEANVFQPADTYTGRLVYNALPTY